MLEASSDKTLKVLESCLDHAGCTVANGFDSRRGLSEKALLASGILDTAVHGLPHGGGGVRAKLVQAIGQEHGVKCGPRTAQRAVEKHFEADVPQWDDFRSVSRGS